MIEKANKYRRKIDTNFSKRTQLNKLGMSRDEKLKNIRNKVKRKYSQRNLTKNKYSQRNLYDKKMRNTANLAKSIESNKLASNSFLHSSSKNILEHSQKKNIFKSTKQNFNSGQTSKISSSAQKKNSYYGEKITMKPLIGNPKKEFSVSKIKNTNQNFVHNKKKMISDSKTLIQMTAPKTSGDALPNSYLFRSDRKILNEKKQNNIQTSLFNNYSQNKLLGFEKNAALQNQQSKIIQSRQNQGMNKSRNLFGERTKNMTKMDSLKNIQNQKVPYSLIHKLNQTSSNKKNRQINFRKLTTSSNKNSEYNNRKLFNPGNVNQFSFPNQIQRNKTIGTEKTFKNTSLNNGTRMKILNQADRSNSRRKQSYLSAIIG